MEVMLVLVLVLPLILYRLATIASRKSNEEALKRELVREFLRKKRLDHLYGRDNENR